MRTLQHLFKTLLNLEPKFIHLENDASYYVQREDNTLFIFFEWSNGKNDWKNNFKFAAKSIAYSKKPYKDMPNPWRVHRGFLSVWNVIKPYIEDLLRDCTIKRVIISGYSHGSAIALLCHEYVMFNRPDVRVRSYAFGGPRVICGKIPKEVKERLRGFVLIQNGSDIVTHLPPVLFGYRHIGTIIKVGKVNRFFLSIKDHFPENYMEALNERTTI